MKKTPDELVLAYQQTGDSRELVKQFRSYLLKWHALIVRSKIDFTNKETRQFLCLYIRDEEIIKCLRKRAKFHTTEVIKKAQGVVEYIQRAYEGYEKTFPNQPNYPYDDVYFELMEIFLELAQDYEQTYSCFENYLQKFFKYTLKKEYIDTKLFGYKNDYQVKYKDLYYSAEIRPIEEALDKEQEETPYDLKFDEYDDLNNILWMNGVEGSDMFKELEFIDRYILVKMYQDNWDCREIARKTGLNHRSVYRRAKNLKDKFRAMRMNGELKWIR